MAAYGTFYVHENKLADDSKTYDVFWKARTAPFETTVIYAALDNADAEMRCERLNAALKGEE